MLQSSLVIHPGTPLQKQRAVGELMTFLVTCFAIASESGRKVSISIQQNIRNDHMAIMVDTGRRTFGHYGKTFEEAIKNTRLELGAYFEKGESGYEVVRPTKKQAARKASSPRRRRAGAASKRRSSKRKG